MFESDVKFYSFSFAAHIFLSRHSSFPWVLHKQLFFTTAFLIHALVVVRCYCVSGFLFICSLYRSFDCPKLYCILVPAVTCRVVTRLMSCALWSLRMQNVHALLCINSEVLFPVPLICFIHVLISYSCISLGGVEALFTLISNHHGKIKFG